MVNLGLVLIVECKFMSEPDKDRSELVIEVARNLGDGLGKPTARGCLSGFLLSN